jgi:nucleoid DNA-binding protein
MSAGRGRHWTLPASKTAAPSGTLTRAGLETKLQERGFTSRKSEMILETILDTMIQCLRGGKNVMVYPLGRFEVRTNPKTRRRRRLGKLQTLYRKPKKVVFRPSDRLRERLAADRGGNQKQGRRV